MKKTMILALIAIAFVTSAILVHQPQRPFSELITANVEALTFDEWGGGNDMGGGVWVHYEYEKITFEHYLCYPYFDPFLLCECEVKTCQGYGDLLCFGYINCY